MSEMIDQEGNRLQIKFFPSVQNSIPLLILVLSTIFLMSLYDKSRSLSQRLHYVLHYNRNIKYSGLQSTYACKP